MVAQHYLAWCRVLVDARARASRRVLHQLSPVSLCPGISPSEWASPSPAGSLHALVVEKVLCRLVRDNMVGLEMAMYLCDARIGAALNEDLGIARANDRSASILASGVTINGQSDTRQNVQRRTS